MAGFLTPAQYSDKVAAAETEYASLMEEANAAYEQATALAAKGTDQRGHTAFQVQTKLLGDLQAQEFTQRIAQDLDYHRLTSVLARDIAATTEKQMALTQKVEQDASVSFFDDPILALINSFTLPWDQQALDATNVRLQSATQQLEKMQRSMTEVSNTSDKIATRITQAVIDDVTAATQANVDQMAAEAAAKAKANRAHQVKQIMEFDKQQLDAYTTDLRIKDQAAQDARAREQHNASMQIAQAKLEEIKNTRIRDTVRLHLINTALVAEGMNPLHKDEVNAFVGIKDDMLAALLHKGLEIRADREQRISHGADPMSRGKYEKLIGWIPQTEQEKTIKLWEAEAIQKAVTEVQLMAGISDAVKQEELRKLSTKYFNEAFDEGQRLRKGDETNPFVGPSYEIINQHMLAAEKTGTPSMAAGVWSKYVVPSLTPHMMSKPLDGEHLASVLGPAAEKGEISLEQAAAVHAEAAQLSAALNNEVKQIYKLTNRYQTQRLSVLPVRTASEIGLGPIGKIFERSERVDEMDQAKLLNYYAKRFVVANRPDYHQDPELGGFFGVQHPESARR